MFKGKKGFTLLELLIVVIIIGILGTLALPRFFRAVERTRWAEAKSVLATLRGAQVRYRAENGAYTATIDNLDVDFTTGKYFTFTSGTGAAAVATATRNATQDAGYSGQTAAIGDDGTFAYSAGVPNWLR